MKRLKWIGLVLVVLIAAIQCVRPEKNIGTRSPETSIEKHFPVPPKVQSVLERSCYDCHSNNTVYPWYAAIQPVGWYLNKHIKDGKRSLNFDEFAGYRLMKQYHRFNDIVEQLNSDEMPLPSYLLIHTYAKLSPEEKSELIQWSNAMRDSMKVRFPADSLERRPRK